MEKVKPLIISLQMWYIAIYRNGRLKGRPEQRVIEILQSSLKPSTLPGNRNVSMIIPVGR